VFVTKDLLLDILLFRSKFRADLTDKQFQPLRMKGNKFDRLFL
jgi:hypothetical protein